MINEKGTKYGTGRTNQSGFYFIKETNSGFSNSEQFGGDVPDIKSAGLSLFEAGKEEQSKDARSGKFYSFYCQITTRRDQKDKSLCGIQGNINKQSGPNSAGRFFSKKGSWPKKRGRLKYHTSMIDCGSKSSHRFTVFSSLTMIQTASVIISYLLNP
ncbi:MAG: hypothetical protein JWQ09_4133 [Segetibacter sp.]|nr:hypothetical protein [Segetibacter sp.]